VLQVLPDLPIAGPDTSDPTWFPSFSQFLSPSSRLRILTSHAYGLNNCVKTLTSPAYPTVPNLLRPYALRLLYKIRSYVALAHANHATFRIDEMGSITCNGREGVSNTFASALWIAAALFTVVQDGVDGVNLHSYPGLPNDLFDFTHGPSGWRAQVKPMFYGALMFARAAPAGSRLVRVSVSGPSTLEAWATAGPDNSARVLLINDSLTSGTTVGVAAPAGFGALPARADPLSAPSAYATGHVTLGGRSYGPSTATGALGGPKPDVIAPRAGTYSVALAPASAVLLTMARPATAAYPIRASVTR
jgi:hypothetical protein